MDAESVSRHKREFLKVLPALSRYIDAFASINKRWGAAITAGMIESGRMDQEAANLFNPLIQDMGSTKEKFRHIQDRLISAILYEIVKKAVIELSDAAKFAINILKRNLYERTADVGYLATDTVLLSFLAMNPDDPDLPEARDAVVRRLGEYQKEYTVYDEIILLDLEGRVRAHLDQGNPISLSSDPLLERTLAVEPSGPGDKYIETFRATDLRPGKRAALIYSQAMLDQSGRQIGVLCLSFDFDDEMHRVFTDLAEGNGKAVVCILDGVGQVIASADESVAPLGATMPMAKDQDFALITISGRQYLATTQRTDGYQGFFGLTWYGFALVEMETAFAEGVDAACSATRMNSIERVSAELASIQQESDDILADMTLDSLNGQVKAAKYKADGFVEVLRFVNGIGREIGQMFEESIAGLQATILSSLSHGLQFRAFQANNIADRNLYERANDVCWWALTPRFREALDRNARGGLGQAEREGLRESLQYINDLYTPYLRLVLADAGGVVAAVSDPPKGLAERLADPDAPTGQQIAGRSLEPELVQRSCRLATPGDYAVSPFAATPLYGGRPTYVFSTAVRSLHDPAHVAGVMQIVFDAEPQFEAMLHDVLPTDEHGRPVEGSFALFAERCGHIIGSTSPDHPPGGKIDLPESFIGLDQSCRACEVIKLSGQPHLVGCQVGAGYREFKITDGYQNDMLCLVFVPI